jgi:hypothetical protein
MKSPLMIFIFLQILDLATTLAALALGGRENNPIVAHIMTVGPVAGLLISKLAVTGLAVAGAALRKYRGLRLANAVFTGVIAWNVTVVARLAMAAA